MRERFVRSCGRFLVTAAIVAMVAVPAFAEEPEQPKQPIGYFELSDDLLTKYEKATQNLARAGEGLKRALKKQEKEAKQKDDASVDATIAAMTEGCETVPEFASAVQDAGLSCREFTLFNITIMQASILSLGFQAHGEKFLDSFHGFQGEHLRANVEFAIAHEDELQKVRGDLQRIFGND